MNPRPRIYVPADQVAICCEYTNRRRVITPAGILDFFHSCNFPPAHPFYIWLQAQTSIPTYILFNPTSSFGRGILKLPFHTRYMILFSWLLHSSLFLSICHNKRILPILRKKTRRKKPPSSVVVILPFFPPLYLRSSSTSAPHAPSPYFLSTILSLLFLHYVQSSYQTPREGIG